MGETSPTVDMFIHELSASSFIKFGILECLSCFLVAKVATRAGAQKVFDIKYLTVETLFDIFDSFEILELVQHF